MNTALSGDPVERQLRRACDELDDRLRAGEPARAEEWLRALPALAAAPDQAVELVFAEYLSREAAGSPPDTAEYFDRFPQYRDRLERLFGVDHLLKASGLSTVGSHTTLPTAPLAAEPSIGPYLVRGKVGEGGMGVVFRAHDPVLNRPVAVKRLHAGTADEPAAVARFRREAELVARLRHPNIAAVYEVGEADGRPYLAIEYAELGNLRDALAGRPQPPATAAVLVAALARAVEHAHRAGVVHRDIKPANVLLTADPADPARPTPLAEQTPKLCDFGLAAAVGGSDGLTRTGQVLGTPSYMPPEQAAGGGAVGPPADVYALGAVLYEMLTGRPPFVGATPLETIRQVCEQPPVEVRALQPTVPRDLEVVCLKCLEKQPANRYPSAAAVADDLDRFRAGEPVRARPVGRLVRAARWCRRRPTAAALVVAGLVAGAAGLGLAGWYTVRLDRARADAVREHRKATAARAAARRALDLTTSAVIDDWFGRQPAMTARNRDYLAQVLANYETFAADAADDPAARADAADAARRVGEVQLLLGRREEAGRSLADARDRLAGLLADAPDDPGLRSRYAAAAERHGTVRERLEDLPGAADGFDGARLALIALAADFPDQPEYRVRLAGVLVHLGRVTHELGAADDGDAHFRAAKALYAELKTTRPDDPAVRAGAGLARAGWADVLMSKEDFAAALDEARAALAEATPLADADPADPAAAFEVAGCQGRIGSLLRVLHRSAEADAPFRAALQTLERLATVYPAVTEYRGMYGRTLNSFALLVAEKNPAGAVAYYEAAADQLTQVLAAAPDSASAAATLGGVYCNHANAVGKADPRAALPLYAKSRNQLAAVLAAHPGRRDARQYLAYTYSGEAHTRTLLKQHAEAAAAWRTAAEYDGGPHIGDYKYEHARSLLRAGHTVEAAAVLDELLRDKTLSAKRVYRIAFTFASAARVAGRGTPAFDEYARRSVATLERARAEGVFEQAEYRKNLQTNHEFGPVRDLPAFRAFVAALPAPKE